MTVSELELQEEYAKNYELALDRFEVEASIKKAPNDNDKEDLKKPSVTAVYITVPDPVRLPSYTFSSIFASGVSFALLIVLY